MCREIYFFCCLDSWYVIASGVVNCVRLPPVVFINHSQCPSFEKKLYEWRWFVNFYLRQYLALLWALDGTLLIQYDFLFLPFFSRVNIDSNILFYLNYRFEGLPVKFKKEVLPTKPTLSKIIVKRFLYQKTKQLMKDVWILGIENIRRRIEFSMSK